MAESVRAKFRVQNLVPSDYGTRVELGPVYGGSKENEQFFQSTPLGSISLTIKNEIAAQFFKPNAEVYVDFTEVPAP